MGRRKKQEAKRLTDLELVIMQVVWAAAGKPLTVREVGERLAPLGREHAYTTVQTMLNILCKKGVLHSEPGPGRAHQYRALVSRNETASSMTHEFVERMFAGEARPLLAQLLAHESVDRAQLEELKRLIESQLTDEEDPA